MKEDTDGGQATETQQHPQEQTYEQAQHAEEEVAATDDGPDEFKALLAKQEVRIKELEGQVAEAAKTGEVADALRGEIEQVKARAGDERVEFELRLAGVRNVKAAKALPDDHDGDASVLKEVKPWLFSGGKSGGAQGGTTGLSNAGAATDEKRLNKH